MGQRFAFSPAVSRPSVPLRLKRAQETIERNGRLEKKRESPSRRGRSRVPFATDCGVILAVFFSPELVK
ncbi:MAG: hypothetical protein DMG38_20345 [Acidobacteria bacterium]|nr:MAG: hypothetical protein DMG38_20345 [Acidobacteriota bacterium]